MTTFQSVSELLIDRFARRQGDDHDDRVVEDSRDQDASGRELQRLLGVEALRQRGDQPAVHHAGRTISYAELSTLVAERTRRLGAGRRLVAIRGGNDLDVVVTLLACFEARHVALVIDGDERSLRSLDRYQPDVIVGCAGAVDGEARANVELRTPLESDSAHRLHAELALLASTSGSTGTAKLVRLSAVGVASNAVAIAESLGLSAGDCGITSLPLSYCYGMSVLTSHLVVGGSLVLTGNSVVDPCFRSDLLRHGVTGLAGVPYTFDLIDHSTSNVLDTPSLRYVTQAGGRLDPGRVSALAEAGRSAGWDFIVMYGQTEATARMAYLPADAAFDHPECVGVPIPGGEVVIDTTDVDGRDDLPTGDHVSSVGEIVYRGPNVMLGYATVAADLARGRDVDELRTGDLGRINSDGLLEIVGRASRFVKIHGKRIDLDHLESTLAPAVGTVTCVGSDELLVVARRRADSIGIGVHSSADPELLDLVREQVAIPAGRVAAISVDEIPRTTSGKTDEQRLLAWAIDARSRASATEPERSNETVAQSFAIVLGVEHVEHDDSFAGLGGDSFSYVEVSIRLEAAIGALPADWHLMTVAELDALAGSSPRRRFVTQLETSVLIRAIGIALIVCTHMGIYRLAGGAHTLLAVLGYNFARFQLTSVDVGTRLKSALSTVGRVAIPTSVWITLNALLFGGYSLGAVLLVNNYTGDAARRGGRWEYWYFEAFAQTMVVLALVFSIGAVRRLERRTPFLFAFAVLAATWLFRFDIIELGGDYNAMFRTHTVAVFVALGWLAARSTTLWQRVTVTGATVLTTVGYFGQTDREVRIILMVSALIWIPRVSLPTPIARVVVTVAAASMWIFLVHWQIWPLFIPWLDDRVAYLLTMASGVVVWRVATLVSHRWAEWRHDHRRRRVVGRSTRSHVNTPDTVISVSDARPVSA